MVWVKVVRELRESKARINICFKVKHKKRGGFRNTNEQMKMASIQFNTVDQFIQQEILYTYSVPGTLLGSKLGA